MKLFRLLLSVLLVVLLIAACGTAAPIQETSERDPEPSGIVNFQVSPRTIMDGEIGQPYTFDLTARGIPEGIKVVTFTWTFTGVKPEHRSVAVRDGVATFSLNRAFGEAGTYALMAAVARPTHPTDLSQGEVLAASRAIIAVETDPVREIALGSCDDWVSANSGGYGVHMDVWDLSSVPEGAVIDMQWDTIGIPDNFVVDYPVAVEVFSTGFVGHPGYDGDPLYPGGVVGGPQGSMQNVFQVSAESGDEFLVTVLGPNRNTRWSYEIRCRMPAE